LACNNILCGVVSFGNGCAWPDFPGNPRAGTDVMILKIFSPKKSAKKLAVLTQNKAKLCKILIKTLAFFSPKIVKNRRKL
jgi:hypothetical protein